MRRTVVSRSTAIRGIAVVMMVESRCSIRNADAMVSGMSSRSRGSRSVGSGRSVWGCCDPVMPVATPDRPPAGARFDHARVALVREVSCQAGLFNGTPGGRGILANPGCVVALNAAFFMSAGGSELPETERLPFNDEARLVNDEDDTPFSPKPCLSRMRGG